MPRPSRENPAVRDFILDNLEAHPMDIVAVTSRQFGLSRAAVNGYLRRAVASGLVTATGRTFARRYGLKDLSFHGAKIELTPQTAEDQVWRTAVEPHLMDLRPNVVDICHYGFTEIFNNVIDHSESATALVAYRQNRAFVEIHVGDSGVGIFEKLQRHFQLADQRTSLLELAKGKFTTDPSRHTGEGIFFASRMFDRFHIVSGRLGYHRIREDDWGWLIETDDLFEYMQGTTVSMQISTAADWTAKDVFERYEDEEQSFAKTHVPIKLGKYGRELLVSRSQARRILARFERFSEVFLDFQDVPEIGRAFADEIFRVFKNENPAIKLVVINATPGVERTIEAVSRGDRTP
jgi:hypothetical protein